MVRLTCPACDKVSKWLNQPFIGQYAAGNVLLSLAILYSGASPTKTLRVLNHMGLSVVALNTFFDHQRSLLWPAVQSRWTLQQTALVVALKGEGRKLVLGADGRADSPGEHHYSNHCGYLLYLENFFIGYVFLMATYSVV